MAVHLRAPCGQGICGVNAKLATDSLEAVTCKNCIKQIEGLSRPIKPRLINTQDFPLRPSRARPGSERPIVPYSLFSKIAGVSKRNEDGTSRQDIIARCRVGEILRLEREPGNPVDENAIRIQRANGQMLGYIPAHLAERDLASIMDEGRRVSCRIADLTGGDEGRFSGVNIEVTIDDDGAIRTNPTPDHQGVPCFDSRPAKSNPELTIIGLALIVGITAIFLYGRC